MNSSSSIRLPFACLLTVVLTLAGCASMSEKECTTADWRLIGYEDGIAGRSTLRLQAHREACAEHGVSPVLDVYLAGHREGVVVYCRPGKVFSLARAGHAYPEICPVELEGELRPAYRDGAKVYQQRSRVKKIEQRMQAKHNEFNEIDQTLADYQKQIIGRHTADHRRLELLAETVSLSKRQDRLEVEIVALEEQLQVRRRQLKRMEASLQY